MPFVNWIDLLIVVLAIYFSWEGVGRSFVGESLDFFFFLVAFILSLQFYGLGGAFFEDVLKIPHSIATIFGFFVIWCIVEILLAIGIKFILKKPVILQKVDAKLKNFSFIPAFLRGLVFVAILLLLVATFPIQPMVKQAVQNSKFGSAILGETYNLEGPLKNIFGGLGQDTLTFLTVEPKDNQSINLGFRTSNFRTRPDLEVEMISLVNRERAKRGIQTLTFDSSLQTIAREHSANMLEKGYFSHYSPEGRTVADRAEENNIDYEVIGENLAYAPSLMLAHNGLMNSPGHRANILSTDYHKIGIGIEDGGVYGLMITQVFSN
jgi:uncharacterized protein YkwD